MPPQARPSKKSVSWGLLLKELSLRESRLSTAGNEKPIKNFRPRGETSKRGINCGRKDHMGGFGPYEKEVLRRWRSVQHIYTFLKREFERLNQTFFEGLLKPTAFQIHPMRLSKRPLA